MSLACVCVKWHALYLRTRAQLINTHKGVQMTLTNTFRGGSAANVVRVGSRLLYLYAANEHCVVCTCAYRVVNVAGGTGERTSLSVQLMFIGVARQLLIGCSIVCVL